MLDANTLLQADATVIAGVLILLTIYSLKIPINIQEKRTQKYLAVAIFAVIVPFAISAAVIVFPEGKLLTDSQRLVASEVFALIGFVYLLGSIFIIVLIPTMVTSPDKS